MNTELNSLDVYRQLAEWYERLNQASMRDRFLVLAADSALYAGLAEEAEMLRQRLLQANPHHLLKPYRSFAEALQTPDVQVYIQDLRTNYPLQVAEDLLRSLQISEDTQAGLDPIHAGGPLGDDATLPLDLRLEPETPGEGLKVYPLRNEPAPQPAPKKTAPPPRSTPARAPASSRPSTPKAPAPRPAAPKPAANRPPAKPVPGPLNQTAPLPRLTPPAPRPARAAHAEPDPFFSSGAAAESESEAPRGVWLTLILLGIVCTAGCALAFYTLARPFWPAGWPPGFPSP